MAFLNEYEGLIRIGVFAGIFVFMAILELLLPRKTAVAEKGPRWFANISLVVVDILALRVFMPVLAIGMAEIATQNGWGLLALIEAPFWIEFIAAFLLLDLLIYIQHIAFHKFPILWRFHKVHHADRDLDVTSGARFHPGESLISMAYKLAVICLIGPAALAVFIFEVVLNAASMFNHANVKIPLGLDRILRFFIVTPDMHRVHHSVVEAETNRNYSFFLSVWDRVLGTYLAQPAAGHDDMVIGLSEYQDDNPGKLGWSLILPFTGKQSDKPAIKKAAVPEERRPLK